MVDQEAGSFADPVFVEAEVAVVDVDAPSADSADDVVMVW